MAGYIYKPQTRKGPVWITPTNEGPPTITLPDGRVIKGVPADQRGGVFHGHEGWQYVFPNDILGVEGAVLTSGGKSQTINTNMSFRGGTVGSLSESSKGAVGSAPDGFEPGQTGYGAYPAYLGGQFPSPTFATFNPIKSAPYKKVDPFDFAQKYGDLARGEIGKNAKQANDLALEQLGTELQGLRNYVPAAAALKRSETSIDNQFNQAERTKQIESTLPGVRGSLAAQTSRANTYATGALPDSVQDRALELGVRSRAADQAYGGGFGTSSSVARKASDLMSAEQRFQVAQYGEGLLGTNVDRRANLELAPTSYSNAGQQVNVMPSLSGSQLSQSNLGLITQQAGLPAGTAFQGSINQEQFGTQLEQGTRQFNASGLYNASQFNAGVSNQFAMDRFGYDVGYAGTVAGAAQTDINAQTEIAQQQAAQDTFNANKDQTQNTNMIRDILAGLVGIGGSIYSAAQTPSTPSTTQPTPTTPSGGGGTGGGGSGDTFATGGNIYDAPPAYPVTPPTIENPPPYDTSVGEGPGSPVPTLPPVPDANVPTDTGSFGGGAEDTFAGDFTTSRSLSIPTESALEFSNFVNDTETPLSIPLTDASRSVKVLTDGGKKVLESAGITSTPQSNSVKIGVSKTGRPMYSDARLARSTDINLGKQNATVIQDIAEPFNIFTPSDRAKFQRIGTMASNPQFLGSLDKAHAQNDMKAFLKEMRSFVGELS